MTNRNQTWSQGGVASGSLLQDTPVPIPQDQVDRKARVQRLRAARGSVIVPANLPQIVADILDLLDV